MQLMPTTQSLLGVSDVFDPRHNITAGVRYLAMLQRIFGNDVSLLLAAYNAGPQAVIAAGYTVPAFAATQRYVQCVLAARNYYQQHGINEQFPPIPAIQTQTDEKRDIVVSSLHLSPKVARVGQRVTVYLAAQHTGTETVRGMVMLTYPEPLVSFVALRTSDRQITVRLSSSQSGQMMKALWATTAYRFLRGSWPPWRPRERRSAALALVPRLPQDLILHLSILVYDTAETTVRHRWSTIIRIPVHARTW
jgi:hypothetical protein